MRQQIFILISISLAALAMACGGVEPGDVGSSTIQPLQTAPMDVLGLDLPGCEDLSGIMGELSENAALLQHPSDGSLRVVAANGGFLCVGGPGFKLPTGYNAAQQGSGGGGSNVQSAMGQDGDNGLVSDDPIPIINEFQGKVEDNSDSQ